MTVTSDQRKSGIYAGNGTLDVLPFNFRTLDSAEVAVIVADEQGAENTLNVDAYSVALNPSQDSQPGGSVLLNAPLAVGHTAIVVSNVPYDQPLDITNAGGFYPDVLENQLDRTTFQIQQLREELGRALKVPISGGIGADVVINEFLQRFGSFGSIYFGGLHEDPYLRPSGEALARGDAYFNTATTRVRIYGGISWFDFSAAAIIDDLASNGGASAIGTASGNTIQQQLDSWAAIAAENSSDIVEESASRSAAISAEVASRTEADSALNGRLSAVELAQAGGHIGYQTLALLNADLAHSVNALAEVTNDSTSANNGTYIKVGVSGSGSWLKSTNDVSGRVSTLEARVDDVAGVLAADQVIGKHGAVVTGSSPSNATWVVNDQVQGSGVVHHVRAFCINGAATIRVKRFTKSGDNFTQVGSDYNVALVDGVNSVSVSIPVEQGEYLGFHGGHNGGSGQHVPFSTDIADSLGYWGGGSGSVSSFTDSTLGESSRPEIGFDIQYILPVVSRIADLADDVADLREHAIEVEGLSTEFGALQTVGVVGVPLNGASNLSAATYAMGPALGSGRAVTFRAYSSGSVTLKLRTFQRSGNTFTQTGSDVSVVLTTGVNEKAIDLPIAHGQYIGFYTPTSGRLRFVPGSDNNISAYDGFYSGTGDVTSFVDDSVNVNSVIQAGFDLEIFRPRSDVNVIAIDNSVRVACIGDSYTANGYCLRNKTWLAKLSAFTDYHFENFGQGGETTSAMLDRIRNNTAHSGAAYRDYKADYALINTGANDDTVYNLDAFRDYLRKLIETVKACGSQPILSTGHTQPYGTGFSAVIKAMAEEHGCLFVDLIGNSLTMAPSGQRAGFWGGSHPATRTNDIFSEPLEEFFKALGPVRQSLKIFRKRPGVSVAALSDLVFSSTYDRCRLFKEIQVGEYALKSTEAKYYDEANTTNSSDQEEVASEYLALMNAGSISFPDYGLIDVVFPVLNKHMQKVELVLSDPSIDVYVKDVLTTPYPSGAQGVWQKLPNQNGHYAVGQALRSRMSGERISFLLYKSGGFSIAAPRVEWIGSQGNKPDLLRRDRQQRPAGVEMLAQPLCGSSGQLAGWTVEGSLTAGVPADGITPRGTTGCVTLSGANCLRQNVTYVQDDYSNREIEIAVTCRNWKPIFSSASTYPDSAPITSDSFDYGKVRIEVITAAGSAVYEEKVGVWWKSARLRTILPVLTSSVDIRISAASGDIEVCRVSTRQVQS